MNQLFLLSFPLSQPNGYQQYQSQHTEVPVEEIKNNIPSQI